MSAHVSLGSQLHHAPHAVSAQIAPKTRAPAVNTGYPIPTAAATRRSISARLSSDRAMKYTTAAMKLTTKNASPMKENVTCRTSQKDRSAGMGGWIARGAMGEEEIARRARATIVAPKSTKGENPWVRRAMRRENRTPQMAAEKNSRDS